HRFLLQLNSTLVRLHVSSQSAVCTFAQTAGRIPDYRYPSGHVACDNRAGPDHCFFPYRHPAQDRRPASDGSTAADAGGHDIPIRLRLGATARGRSRKLVVDEHNPMADENVVLNGHTLADESMA